MAYVILDICETEKSGECVTICPVDCIEEGTDQYFIDPNTCIDCGACVAACPVNAIVDEHDLTDEQEKQLEKAEHFFL
ncbi:4Fe-4S binding protein [Virgibacillus pantothenticus]|uniref:indolepyruvate ferredoxin oxidoreductase subunit alpha n=1 Tax=Virgibacillus TaxID=84406 RepID=UPI00090BA487|nr:MULTISPECIES: 4Fe-4S binding protein [Virgibacillus]API92026.1 4Fe-4S ferredoxin [Virgibacillus sp. 6R]MBS7430489.1 4Fe-4S binding protein [Virgibacillus sp. 19R1-5]MBU8566427.1 4Fe-4S binding protein [Virgibacillus pantothenticus]MBU8600158.1 4Fe-4S binding protein [Virgibacillus pantothenticus]MBU8633910.1 4Fe-4S binding protein [Virgibacillus pantothenticus]